MAEEKHYTHKDRDAAPEEAGTQPQRRESEITQPQDDMLILLAQQIEAKRTPARYLEGWIRRFVRG